MTITHADAIGAFPELAQLALLPRAGWRFQPIAEDGELVCLVGWRNRAEAIDALWIYGRTDCLAARLVAASGGIVWDYTGSLASCVEELLALPGPGEPAAPRLVRARGAGLWTP
jgi:hypothetical protein